MSDISTDAGDQGDAPAGAHDFGDLTPELLAELRSKADAHDELERELAAAAEDTDDDDPEQDQGERDEGEHDEDASRESKNAEAARYRTRLRGVEAERDALKARVADLQRADIERQLGVVLAQPADLWDIGKTTLTDLLDDDGNVDIEKVSAAASALLSSRPGLAFQPPRPVGPSSGGYGGTHGGGGAPKPTWQDLLRGGGN